MKFSFSLCFLVILFGIKSTAKSIIVEHLGGSKTFDNIDSAIDYSVNGDIIYLPGGSFEIKQTIRKGITLIGSGTHPDSSSVTGQTTFTNAFLNIKSVSNFSMSGVYIPGDVNIDSCTVVSISQCIWGSKFSSISNISNSSSVIIKGSILCGLWLNNSSISPSVTEVSNSIIYGPTSGKNIKFTNNIFMYPGDMTTSLFDFISGSNFTNNVIQCRASLNEYGKKNYYVNNVFTDTVNFILSVPYFTGNLFKKAMNDIFQSVTSLSILSLSNDFHLKSGSPALGTALGGGDCGIYGNTNPFKEGLVPFNPHFTEVVIPPVTEPDGKLRFSIKAVAQDN